MSFWDVELLQVKGDLRKYKEQTDIFIQEGKKSDDLEQELKVVKDNLQKELEKFHKNTSLKGPLVGAKHLA